MLVKPKTCRRCSGRGYVEFGRVVHAGAPRTCFKCDGFGEVESDPATLAAAKARSEAISGIIRFVMDALVARGMSSAKAIAVSYGLDHLAQNAPDRYEAALVSYQNRHPRLVEAVVTYTAEAGFFHYGTRNMTAAEVLASLDS